jgi:hypothetical protein
MQNCRQHATELLPKMTESSSELGRPKRDPGEFAELVGLFVGQAAAAKTPHRVAAMGVLSALKSGDHAGKL